MRLAAGVIAILAFPLVVYFIDPSHETLFSRLALGILGTLGAGLLVISFSLSPPVGPDRSVDEPAVDRRLAITALLGATVAASLVVLFARDRTPLISIVAVAWSLVWVLPMTRRFSVTTHVLINRDPKTVFEYLLDARNQMQYVPELVSVEKLTPGDIGPGTQFLSKVRMDGLGVFEGVEEIVDIQWGQRIVDRVANGTHANRGILTFTSEPPGTLLAYRFESEVSYPSAFLGQGIMRWAMTGEMRQRRLAIWARLKQVLESAPAA